MERHKAKPMEMVKGGPLPVWLQRGGGGHAEAPDAARGSAASHAHLWPRPGEGRDGRSGELRGLGISSTRTMVA